MSNNTICIKINQSPIFDPLFWESTLEILSNLATILAAVIAIAAAFIAYNQLQSSKKQSALNYYQQYLQLCIDYPEFSKGYKKPDEHCIKYQKYTWFVSKMLFSFEQMMLEITIDKQWDSTIKAQLSYHKDHLSQSKSVKRKEWEKPLQDLIDSIIK